MQAERVVEHQRVVRGENRLNDDHRSQMTGALLTHLQEAVSSHAQFDQLPERITGGFDTLTYQFSIRGTGGTLDQPLVLRMYREPVDGVRARFEAALTNAVVDLGFPAPRVLLSCEDPEVIGRPFIIMQRVPGTLLVRRLFGPSILTVPGIVADAHVRLHSLDGEVIRSAIARVGCDTRTLSVEQEIDDASRRIERADLHGFIDALRYIEGNFPVHGSPVMCHGDFHPLNILVEGGALPGVVDWASNHARLGPAEYDIGATTALMKFAPVRVPSLIRPLVDWLRNKIAANYLTEYARQRPSDPNSIRYFEALRCFGFMIEASERLLADQGILAPISKPSAFVSPRVRRRVMARFAKISGVRMEPPSALLEK